jgi:hypothetical protein
MPVNSFSVRWTGTFHFDEGTYRFYAKVDDGVRVYLDGVQIIDGWRDGGVRTFNVDRALASGDHDIKVEYYDRIQVARIHFWMKQLSGPVVTPTTTSTTDGQISAEAWRAVIAEYWLDELLEPDEPGWDLRQEISHRLHKAVNDCAREVGAEILEVRMGPLEPTLDSWGYELNGLYTPMTNSQGGG